MRRNNPEYMREWRRKNKQYIREYGRKYREEHPESHREWRAKNAEKYKEYHRKYRKNHKEQRQQHAREYRKNNPEKMKAHNMARKCPLSKFCELCPEDDKNEATQRYHPSYDFPLIIVSTCRLCHYYVDRSIMEMN